MIDALSRQLYIGTRHGEPAIMGGVPSAQDPLGSLSAEEQLLAHCAVADVYETAARLPQNAPLPDHNAVEDPREPAGAVGVLDDALRHAHLDLISEWMALTTGKRPPFRLLPTLLDLGADHPQLRPMIAEAVGPRGGWLAGQNPAWAWMVSKVEPMNVWEEGTLAERKIHLKTVRLQTPDRARELLEQTLSQEKAPVRAQLINVLEIGLGPGDEPFLEALLSDRSTEVRRTCGALLSAIEASAFARRMTERLARYVRFGKNDLYVELPEGIDDAMKHDGIAQKQIEGQGAKAALLMQIAAMTPLGWWQTQCDQSVEKIIKRIEASEWKTTLIPALIDAACIRHDAEWIEALLTVRDEPKMYVDRHRLIASLTPDALRHWMIHRLDGANFHLLAPLPPSLETPWDEAVSRAVLLAARKAFKRIKVDYQFRDVVNQSAAKLHPAVLDEAADNWPVDENTWDYYESKLAPFFEMIRLRRALYMTK